MIEERTSESERERERDILLRRTLALATGAPAIYFPGFQSPKPLISAPQRQWSASGRRRGAWRRRRRSALSRRASCTPSWQPAVEGEGEWERERRENEKMRCQWKKREVNVEREKEGVEGEREGKAPGEGESVRDMGSSVRFGGGCWWRRRGRGTPTAKLCKKRLFVKGWYRAGRWKGISI